MTNPDPLPIAPHPFAEASIDCLGQGLALLESLTDEEYVATYPPACMSTIGAHMRHILDHYWCFVAGLETGCVDYDARERDVRLETERVAMIGGLRAAIARLDDIGALDSDRDLAVRMDCGVPGEAETWTRSTVARELQFLLSHTVHHYALVAIRLRLAGREPAPGFGVSPSTLRYRGNQP